MSYHYQRKADRDCPVRNALVNMLEDIDAAQVLLDAGRGLDGVVRKSSAYLNPASDLLEEGATR